MFMIGVRWIDNLERELASKAQKYDVVTFDCYGTLIDWESGVRIAFERLLGKTLVSGSRNDARLFKIYEQEERRIEAAIPFRKYREVMSLSAENVSRKLGKDIRPGSRDTFADELTKWKPFPETNVALERIAANHELGILSNVDDDLLEKTMRHFTVPFDFVVTAQRVRSYKPSPRHFEEAKRLIGPDRQWLHVAGSLYHDIAPASALGISSAWVNRHGLPTERIAFENHVKEVRSLTELADWLESK